MARARHEPKRLAISTASAITTSSAATPPTMAPMAIIRRHHHGRGGLWKMFSKTYIAVERPEPTTPR